MFGIRLYDTNLSYHFSFWVNRKGIECDWWYDVGMRHNRWMPLEIRFYTQQEKVKAFL